MMQAAFTMTKPRLDNEQVCCDVIYENQIDLKFFAELCKSVIDREMATDAGIRKYRRERYPPPGMLERCRKKILELCNIDISEALVKSKKGKFSIDLRKTSNDTDRQSPQLNLTECLEKHFQLSRPLPRRFKKEKALPSHIKQERPQHVGPQVPHPALTKRGSPFHSTGPPRSGMPEQPRAHPVGNLRPSLGGPGKTGPSSKGGGAMGFIMPIYTVGIVVFFLYTITKVLFRKPEHQTPKVMDFHMDPEYRKYVLSEEYGNGVPLTYGEYLKKRANEERNKKTRLLDEKGRKQVFTAIEGIIAEMDDFRDKLMAEHTRTSFDKEDESLGVTSEEDSRTRSEIDDEVEDILDDQQPVTEDIFDFQTLDIDSPVLVAEEVAESTLEEPVNELAEQLKLITGDSKIAILGMETQAEFHEKTPEPEEPEISNIILETSVPCDTQLLVAESQCLTHTSTNRIEGWSDYEDQPVVVTGKMTISLLGKEASVHSTESKMSKLSVGPATLDSIEDDQKKQMDKSSKERQQIEELANALIEDILHNQVPKVFESAVSKMSTPDMDTFEMLVSPSVESRKEFNSGTQASRQRQYSRESQNSQGSSFEYVSACQDESSATKTNGRPRLSPPRLNTVVGGDQSTDFELIKNGAAVLQPLQQQKNGSSPASFECISIGSTSPLLSPEYETSFEKVQLPADAPVQSSGQEVEPQQQNNIQCMSHSEVLTPNLEMIHPENSNLEVNEGQSFSVQEGINGNLMLDDNGGFDNELPELGQCEMPQDSLCSTLDSTEVEKFEVISDAPVIESQLPSIHAESSVNPLSVESSSVYNQSYDSPVDNVEVIPDVITSESALPDLDVNNGLEVVTSLESSEVLTIPSAKVNTEIHAPMSDEILESPTEQQIVSIPEEIVNALEMVSPPECLIESQECADGAKSVSPLPFSMPEPSSDQSSAESVQSVVKVHRPAVETQQRDVDEHCTVIQEQLPPPSHNETQSNIQ